MEIEIASLSSRSRKGNGVAPPPEFHWTFLEPHLFEPLFGCDVRKPRRGPNRMLGIPEC